MTSQISNISPIAEMFCPPANRAMRVLDRSFFQKTVPLAAVQITSSDQIGPCRKFLGRDVLQISRVPAIQKGPHSSVSHSTPISILLRPEIRPHEQSTWTSRLKELEERQHVSIVPFDLNLTYDCWNYLDIMQAILPDEAQDELPTGFSVVGHVAHLNLRERFLPYKYLIAEVLLDKNPTIRTVINKVEPIGVQNEYRTFDYELLRGENSLQVEIREQECIFRFDYSKVYWNSRLNTEHERVVGLFKTGEAVCDVMAGIGPFAVPAGKKKVFVYANDLNPDSYAGLERAITLNKVSDFVRSYNTDGREFIRQATKELATINWNVDITPRPKRRSHMQGLSKPDPVLLRCPQVFSHYVMNLPASAIMFLDAFIGIYHGQEHLFAPSTAHSLPMIHVHCFSTKSADNAREHQDICERISKQINYTIRPGDEDVQIWDVRDVAPLKRMFCATFRLPADVAFAHPAI